MDRCSHPTGRWLQLRVYACNASRIAFGYSRIFLLFFVFSVYFYWDLIYKSNMDMEVEYLEDEEVGLSLESIEHMQANLQTGAIETLDADGETSDAQNKDEDRSKLSNTAK